MISEQQYLRYALKYHPPNPSLLLFPSVSTREWWNFRIRQVNTRQELSRGIPGRVLRRTTGLLHHRLIVLGRIRDDNGIVGGETNHGSGRAAMKDEASTGGDFRNPGGKEKSKCADRDIR